MNKGLFSQQDERWGPIPLGMGGGHTLATAGCLVSVLAGMLVDSFGVDTDPGRLNRWLCRNGGFTSGNLVVFNALSEFGVVFQVRDCIHEPAPIDDMIAVLDNGGGVLAKMDFYPGGTVQQHYVRVLQADQDDCLVHDPWLVLGGETTPSLGVYSMMARYSHWSWSGPARAIYRLVFYEVATPYSIAIADGADGKQFAQDNVSNRRFSNLRFVRWWRWAVSRLRMGQNKRSGF